MFTDREQAGHFLAGLLRRYEGRDVVVLAIPRGGVPVGFAVARELRAPLDIVSVRKLPIPFDPEAGFGAVTAEGAPILNEEIVRRAGLRPDEVEGIVKTVVAEVGRRDRAYRVGRQRAPVRGRDAIIVDDGLATGYTMLAAVGSALERGAVRVIVAVPCGSQSALNLVSRRAGEVYCIMKSEEAFFAVASFYDEFPDLSDDDVRGYLDLAAAPP